MGLGVYIPILRIPIKGRTITNIGSLDPGTDDVSAAGDSERKQLRSRAQVT